VTDPDLVHEGRRLRYWSATLSVAQLLSIGAGIPVVKSQSELGPGLLAAW
jgi:hypothetical protein